MKVNGIQTTITWKPGTFLARNKDMKPQEKEEIPRWKWSDLLACVADSSAGQRSPTFEQLGPG